MKIALFLLLSTISLKAQDYQIEPTIIQADSLSKAEIFDGIRYYLANNYIEADEVIKLKDRENGVIILKGSEPNKVKTLGSTTINGYWHYTAKFEVKKGRYRFSVYNTTLNHKGTQYSLKSMIKYKKNRINFENTMKELKSAFSKIPLQPSNTNSDW